MSELEQALGALEVERTDWPQWRSP
jgi:hypothetical protein